METSEAVQYIDVPPNDGRYEQVLHIIRNSFLDPHYQPSWVIYRLQAVKNLRLYQRYRTKCQELLYNGRDVTEHDMFTCYKTVDFIDSTLEYGLQARASRFNFLGNSEMGVNLCRHADIQLKAAENAGQVDCYLIIYKVVLGKTLPVYPSPKNQHLAPTENYDSHISSIIPDRTLPLGQQAIRAQVFCYEYSDNRLLSCPRNVLPFIVVHYKRPLARDPPRSGPSQTHRTNFQPTPFFQMPVYQESSLPKSCNHDNNRTETCDLQPEQPSRNSFPEQDVACSTFGQCLHRTISGIWSEANNTAVHSFSHQPTAGLQLTIPSPDFSGRRRVPDTTDNTKHIHEGHRQNFSNTSSAVHLLSDPSNHLSTIQIVCIESIPQTITSHPEAIAGMSLPIVIQPEESITEEMFPLNEQTPHLNLPNTITKDSLIHSLPTLAIDSLSTLVNDKSQDSIISFDLSEEISCIGEKENNENPRRKIHDKLHAGNGNVEITAIAPSNEYLQTKKPEESMVVFDSNELRVQDEIANSNTATGGHKQSGDTPDENTVIRKRTADKSLLINEFFSNARKLQIFDNENSSEDWFQAITNAEGADFNNTRTSIKKRLQLTPRFTGNIADSEKSDTLPNLIPVTEAVEEPGLDVGRRPKNAVASACHRRRLPRSVRDSVKDTVLRAIRKRCQPRWSGVKKAESAKDNFGKKVTDSTERPSARHPFVCEVPVFKFHKNGSVTMSWDIRPNGIGEKKDENKCSEVYALPRTRVLFDKGLSDVDAEVILKRMPAASIDFEIVHDEEVVEGEQTDSDGD